MRLINHKYNFSFDFEDSLINTLVCESESAYNDIVTDLYNLEMNSSSNFILSFDKKQIDFKDNCEIIYNPFKIDINNKKNIEKLYYQLSKQMCTDNMFIEKNEIIANLCMYINKLSVVSEYGILYNDGIDDKSILRLVGVEIENDGGFVDKLINYMCVTNKLQGNKLYIFINLKSFVVLGDILKMYKDIEYNKLNILLIENMDRKIVNGENKIVIDKDSCIIA